ncbi:MAG: DUF5411 family protein [Bacilli bacterium]
MKESLWGYLVLILGIMILVVMILVRDITSTTENDYYLTKEAMNAAMVDSLDYGTYMQSGEIRIISDKFVENFTRRFAQSVSSSKTYKIEFYEIYETPPKATIRITTSTKKYTVTTNDNEGVGFDIVTLLSGVLETKY